MNRSVLSKAHSIPLTVGENIVQIDAFETLSFLKLVNNWPKCGSEFGGLLLRHLTPQRTRSSADADNRLDAFSGQ